MAPKSRPTLSEWPFQFPLVVIDFEATALTCESYPIEVGIAIAIDPSTPIVTWSSLIAPPPEWNLASQWDPDAERIHAISQWNLRQGKTPREVMLMLNDLIRTGQKVWCDGGHYDARWLDVLADAAGVRPVFELHDIGTALQTMGQTHIHHLNALKRSQAPHRAGPDAERICTSVMMMLLAQ